MANVQANPWSFTSSDAVQIGISNLSQHSENSQLVDMTTSTPHGLSQGSYATVIRPNPVTFTGLYLAINIPSTTVATLQRIPGTSLPSGLVYNSSGEMLSPLYIGPIRGEDMSWQNAQTAGDEIQVYSAYGIPVWDTIAPTNGNYSRGKPFWFIGISLAKLSSGTLFLTVN